MTIEESSTDNMPTEPSRFPSKTIVFTALVSAVAAGLKFGSDWLNDAINLDPGMPNLALLIFAFVIWLAWLTWIMFYSSTARRWRLAMAAGWILVPLGLLAVFQPIFDGDLKIVGWKHRLSQPQVTATGPPEASPAIGETGQINASDQDFPQFLGKNRNATVEGIELATDWKSSPPKIRWKQPIGEGWSGFAVVGDFAFTQEQLLDQECVSCYRVDTGDLIWQHRAKRRHEDVSAMGRAGPRATPTVFDQKVYAMGGTGVLECLDANNGDLLWSVDVPATVGIEMVQQVNSNGLSYVQENSSLSWGRSTSPLVYNEMVIVPGGGPVDATPGSAVTLLAFDCESGEERWRGGERNVSYGSPSLTEILGQTQIVLVVENAVVGHDPETGMEMWSHPWPGNSNSNASCSQVTTAGQFDDSTQLLLSKGYGIGGELIELTRYEGELVSSTIAKSSRILKTKFTNPVLLDGFAYSLSDGFLECAELPSLDRKWKKRGRFGNGQLLLVGNKLLVHSETGKLHLVAATPDEYRELASFDTIDGVCWNTLALSGNRLLVRSELEAAMLELPLAR